MGPSVNTQPLPAMAAAMKAMKVMGKAAMKAMKARRAMKKKSIIATGRLAKVMVLRGSKARTVGGLKASDLLKKKNVWIIAVKKARAALKIKGFCAIKKGTPLYAK